MYQYYNNFLLIDLPLDSLISNGYYNFKIYCKCKGSKQI